MQLLGVVALVAATVAACAGEPAQPSPGPATTPTPPATSTSSATGSQPPTGTATTAPSPRTTAKPSPAPVAPGAMTFRYDTYDTTGAVATSGSYAFLANQSDTTSVVTTYEALRDGTATALLIHESDAGGTSRDDVYDAV